KEFPKALDDYAASIKLLPDYFLSHRNKAFLRAACPQAELRDGTEAVALALKSIELNTTSFQSWQDYETLAAAYGEVGDFEKAKEAQRKAIDLAKPQLKVFYREQLQLYESGKPYRTP